MSNQNLTEQLEVTIQQFKANSPIEAQSALLCSAGS